MNGKGGKVLQFFVYFNMKYTKNMHFVLKYILKLFMSNIVMWHSYAVYSIGSSSYDHRVSIELRRIFASKCY